jgi:tRNA 2-selenouridine synthase
MKINIEEFLMLAESIPVIDVRSPSEFNHGHIPGAVNIPLFNDGDRAAVGTLYKNEGRLPAIMEGLKKAGPTLALKLDQAHKVAHDKLLVHCWRGGMRSEAMAWLFSLGGIETKVLEGGYKSYRHHVLERFSEKRKMIVLGGMTGSSKTHILRHLREIGQHVIDLEALASHKGSAFGSLGQMPQPTTEHFSNLLFSGLRLISNKESFWVEDESRNIGTVFMPGNFYQNMQETPAIILMMDVRIRLPRLLKEYSAFPADSLKASVFKISKRIGGDNTRDAIEAIDAGNFSRAIEITLGYYDKAYSFGLKKKASRNIIIVNTDTDDVAVNSMKVLEAADSIKW